MTASGLFEERFFASPRPSRDYAQNDTRGTGRGPTMRARQAAPLQQSKGTVSARLRARPEGGLYPGQPRIGKLARNQVASKNAGN